MKNLLSAIFLTLMLGACPLPALDRVPLEQLNIDSLLTETQKNAAHSENQIAYIWYIPPEFWTAVLLQDSQFEEEERRQMTEYLQTVTVFGVILGERMTRGYISYQSHADAIRRSAEISYAKGDKEPIRLQPFQRLPKPLADLLGTIAPGLGYSLGAFGENLQFVVISDIPENSTGRLVDPYVPGALRFTLRHRGKILETEFPLPLNSLYAPRLCPQGHLTNVRWNYCPACGEKLPAL